jgi:hypothetical protein
VSRGPGRWQRAILEALEADPSANIVLTRTDDPRAVQSAVRRAAAQLEAAGKIRVVVMQVEGYQRLVAVAAGSAAPPPFVVTGLDRKKYKRLGWL